MRFTRRSAFFAHRELSSFERAQLILFTLQNDKRMSGRMNFACSFFLLKFGADTPGVSLKSA